MKSHGFGHGLVIPLSKCKSFIHIALASAWSRDLQDIIFGRLSKGPATTRERQATGCNNGVKEPDPTRDPCQEDRYPEKPERGERMTKNKTREGPLPPADKGVNDARPGLPTPTVRKNVTWVQPEPTTSDVTRPQQLSPDTTWAEPSTAKSKLAKGSPGLSTTRDHTKE